VCVFTCSKLLTINVNSKSPPLPPPSPTPQIEQNKLDGMDLSGLLQATETFAQASVSISEDMKQCDVNDNDAVYSINLRLSLTERQFLNVNGLPGRPWFRHILQVSACLHSCVSSPCVVAQLPSDVFSCVAPPCPSIAFNHHF
jgi:hypothetical protein